MLRLVWGEGDTGRAEAAGAGRVFGAMHQVRALARRRPVHGQESLEARPAQRAHDLGPVRDVGRHGLGVDDVMVLRDDADARRLLWMGEAQGRGK